MHHSARPIAALLGSVGGAAALMCTGTAAAQPATGASITVGYTIPLPSGPPNVVSGSGTFSSTGAITDAGDVDVTARYTAVPSPSVGVLQSLLVLRGASGTIELRCEQQANDFTDPAAVPDTGTCAIVSGSGVYAGAHGSGKVIGSADVTAAQPAVTETITF
jgi:hypothetical protein